MVEETASGEAAGICGLVKREELDDVDVGFAFLPRFWSRGYATESAAAVVDYAWTVVHLPRLVAITNPDNVRSINVLEKVGLRFEKLVTFGAEGRELKLFACAAPRDA
jgi:RimJ/RimL family protein N-acetyltransferase